MSNKLSVRGRIVAAFTLLLICTVGLGLFAVNRLAELDAAAAEVRNGALPSTRILGQVAQLTERVRSYQGLYFLADSDAERLGRTTKTAKTVTELRKALEDYRALITLPEEQRLAEAMTKTWALYDRQSSDLAGLMGQEQSRAEALKLFKIDMLPSIDAFRVTLEADMAFNLRQGQAMADHGSAVSRAAHAWILAALACTAGFCILCGWSMVRTISVPVTRMTTAMRRLADHDMAVEVPCIGRRDEIGAMATAVQVFKDAALQAQAQARQQAEGRQRRAAEDEQVRQESERAAASEAASLVVGSIGKGLEHLAAGDLTFRLQATLPQAYEKLRADFNGAMGELQALVRQMTANTTSIGAGTHEITQASDDLSRRTEQQAASLEQTAAALDQITATVRKTADGAKRAFDVAGQAKTDAEQSGDIVRKAVAAMDGIEQSSRQIGQIIGVVDEIAFQTSLLALNAGVEAARAGDAGRGFAVVASEVRALAQRSATAAKEIKALIQTSAQQVGAGADLVGETGQALTRIVTRVSEVANVVGEIAASAQEQSTGLHEVNTAVNQMDQITQQNAAMVEQATAATHSLAAEAAELVQLAARFKVGAGHTGSLPGPRARAAA